MYYRQLLYSAAENAFPFLDNTPTQQEVIGPDQMQEFYANSAGLISVSTYISFLMLLTESICLVYLLDSFLECRIKWKRRIAPLLALLYFAAVQLSNSQLGSRTEVWGHLLILIGFTICFYKGSASLKGYVIVTFWALISLCSSLWFFIDMLMWLHYGLFRFPDIVLATFPTWPFFETPYPMGLGYELTLDTSTCFSLILTCIVLALSVRKLVRGMRYSLDHIHRKELLFLLMPSFAGLIVYLFLELEKKFLFFQKAVDWATNYGIVLYLLTPLLIVTTMLCILYAYDIYQQLLEYMEEKGRTVILEQEMGQMQDHIGEIEQLYNGIRAVKHDMQNYLFDIKSLLAAQGIAVDEEESELGGYLAGIGKSLDTFNYSLHTGNPVTDVVLNGKLSQARAIGAAFNCSFLFPSDLGISAFDISIILNNALNNALEACQNLRSQEPEAGLDIEVTSYCKTNMFFIVIQNSFDGILYQNPADLSPATRKADTVWHGLGFQNIRKSAEKYLGSADCQVKGNRFILTVMLQGQMEA